MGERRLVALLKELINSLGPAFSINISPLRGFPTDSDGGASTELPQVAAAGNVGLKDRTAPRLEPGRYRDRLIDFHTHIYSICVSIWRRPRPRLT